MTLYKLYKLPLSRIASEDVDPLSNTCSNISSVTNLFTSSRTPNPVFSLIRPNESIHNSAVPSPPSSSSSSVSSTSSEASSISSTSSEASSISSTSSEAPSVSSTSSEAPSVSSTSSEAPSVSSTSSVEEQVKRARKQLLEKRLRSEKIKSRGVTPMKCQSNQLILVKDPHKKPETKLNIYTSPTVASTSKVSSKSGVSSSGKCCSDLVHIDKELKGMPEVNASPTAASISNCRLSSKSKVSSRSKYSSDLIPKECLNMCCIECRKAIDKEHFTKLVTCSKCSRYSTNCVEAYVVHMICEHSKLANKERFFQNKPSEVQLSQSMFCICGFSNSNGNTLANHMVECGQTTCYPSRNQVTAFAVKKEPEDESEDHLPENDSECFDPLEIKEEWPFTYDISQFGQ